MPDLMTPPDEDQQIDAGIEAGIDQAQAYANDPANSGSGLASRAIATGLAVGGVVARNKKPLIGGGIIGILGLAITGFLSYGPLKLEHITQRLFDHNFSTQVNWEKKEGHKVLGSLFGSRLNTDGSRKGGYGLRARYNDFKIDSFKSKLADKGYNLEFKDGKFTGITGPDGKFIDLNDSGVFEKRAAIRTAVDDTIPHWRVGKILKYRRLMASHARVSFKLFAVDKVKATTKDFYDRLRQKVQTGAPESEVAATVGEETPKDPNAPPDANAAEHQSTAKSLSDVINGARDTFNTTGSSAAAIKAGLDIFGTKMVTRSLLITGTVTMLCATEQEVVKAADQTEIQKADQLMRHGNLLLTADSQMHEGTGLSGRQFGDFMGLFDGDSSANVQVSDKGQKTNIAEENTKSFDQSAAWHRSNDQPVTSANPELAAGANPNPDSNQQLINNIDGALSSVGGKAVCGALTSKAGFFIQLGVGIVQVVADIGTLGGAQAAVIAGNVTAQFAFMRYALPQIIAMFTNVAITGTENAVQWLNNSDAGLGLAGLDYGRSMGAGPVSDSQFTAMAQEADKSQTDDFKAQPLYKQMLAISSPYSFASRFLDQLPSPHEAMASTFSTFSHLPNFIAGNLFSPKVILAGDSLNSVNPYGFNLNGFTDNEIGKYDPLENEDWLTTPVSLPDGGGKTIQVKRIDVLGDPNNFQPTTDPNSDTNSEDLLHCFENKYVSWKYRKANQQSAEDGTGFGVSGDQTKICGTVGVIEKVAYQAPDVQYIFCHYQKDRTNLGATCNPDVTDAIGHFRQYLLDLHIADDIVSLSNDQ
jgi:hypothetical protein